MGYLQHLVQNLVNVQAGTQNRYINTKKDRKKITVGLDNSPKLSYIQDMKEKKLTITSKNISQKQWSNLILELNLITKAWAPYATISLHAPGIKKVIAHGTRTNFKED